MVARASITSIHSHARVSPATRALSVKPTLMNALPFRAPMAPLVWTVSACSVARVSPDTLAHSVRLISMNARPVRAWVSLRPVLIASTDISVSVYPAILDCSVRPILMSAHPRRALMVVLASTTWYVFASSVCFWYVDELLNFLFCCAACTEQNSFSCLCVAGYSGTMCRTNINECASNPCRNGATCVDGVDSFSCTCVAGYSGVLCQTDINECASNPCIGLTVTCQDAMYVPNEPLRSLHCKLS